MKYILLRVKAMKVLFLFCACFTAMMLNASSARSESLNGKEVCQSVRWL